ncbi:MAG TPA: T9SS type A sorting domain-containing protein [bacterium]|nr:T9SS type A sorting domain-containing protein [bacterium]
MLKRKLSGNILNFCKLFLLILFVVVLIPTPSNSQDHESWSYNLNIYEVNLRQYTASGTFAEFAAHLNRLQDLGVGIVWFMPIHPIGVQNRLGSLGSYYSVRDYLDINPEFGALNDFKALVDAIHARGMYVILDWVGNHTAWDNPLTKTHPEWYVTDSNGNFVPPFGTNWTDVIQLDYSKQGVWDYMIQAMTYWIDEADIDGFRCDAVSFMPLDFWSAAITTLKNVKPEIFMLAEDDGPQYQSVGFDMTYAWGLHGFGNGVLKRITNGTSNAAELDRYITNELNSYSSNHYRMYFTSNHDENSWHGTVFEQFGDAAEPFAVLTATMNGMPLIYSGQEAGLNKRLRFFDKDQIPWQPHPFADMYSTLLQLKKENKALWNGSNGGQFQRVNTTNDQTIFAFVREKENDKIFAVFNFSPGYNGATLLDTLFCGSYTDVFTNDTVSFYQGASITLPGWDYNIYQQASPTTGIVDDFEMQQEFVLYQNYPNPFNPTTTIRYHLPKTSQVLLKIYNLLGEDVRTLMSEKQSGGEKTVVWDGKDRFGRDVDSGIYLYRLKVDNYCTSRRMLLLR